MEIYQERENLRNQIKTFWKEGRTWTGDEPIATKDFNQIFRDGSVSIKLF